MILWQSMDSSNMPSDLARGDDVDGPQLTFNLAVDADKAVSTPGGQQVSASNASKSLPHTGIGHSDTLTSANLTATVVTSFPGCV